MISANHATVTSLYSTDAANVQMATKAIMIEAMLFRTHTLPLEFLILPLYQELAFIFRIWQFAIPS